MIPLMTCKTLLENQFTEIIWNNLLMNMADPDVTTISFSVVQSICNITHNDTLINRNILNNMTLS